MRPFLAFCLLLGITLPCQAQGDKTKPNTLTPKEIADGWILLFDGETTFGWDVKGEAEVKDGLLVLGRASTIAPKAHFAECELIFECQVAGKGEPSVDLYPKGNWWLLQRGLLGFGDREGWTSVRSILEKSKETKNRVVVHGEFKGPAGAGKAQRAANGDAYGEIRFKSPGGCKLFLRNIKLRPVNAASLFNGKDLDGWKEFPGKKSKFAVVDGAINVKNGPGDLQTNGKYKDFILQLECISHGKHLNSGIFFRCRDNEYQNGYEAQIRNQFTPEATQEYTIEEYDPKTNKLIGKNKIKSTAFDYGTGAIYRRQPARKEMAKDGEWFGMTIVAQGNHLATWVNGVQVTDWYDNRPQSGNARTGCKLEAGHISIQGHDPTTNLSFRNFRIAEMPEMK
jgi:hypothetical protein